MARRAAARPLSAPSRARLRIDLARAEDEGAIRRLLRETEFDGAVRVSFEREPDSRIAAGIEGERHHTVLVRERATDRVVGMGSRAVRRVWFDGQAVLVGYLGLLRGDRRRPLAAAALAEAFAALDATRRPDELPWDYTAIVADNLPARRLLERHRPGLPEYRSFGGIRTALIPTRRARDGPEGLARGSVSDLRAIAEALRREHAVHPFAPVWTEADLRDPVRCRGLRPEDFRLVCDAGGVACCAALWDQREFKQTVVRGYSSRLARWRRALNLLAMMRGSPSLPNPGSRVELAFLSHLTVNREEHLRVLCHAAQDDAARRGILWLAVGFAEHDPFAAALARFVRCRTYAGNLYVVRHPGREPIPRAGIPGVPRPEIALL